MNKKKSAIKFEEVLKRPLGEINAAQFLEVLHQASTDRAVPIGILADKKKYELWIEEGQLVKIPVGVIIEKLRGEKKKVELEPVFDPGRFVFPADRTGVTYNQLVEDVAARVAERLK